MNSRKRLRRELFLLCLPVALLASVPLWNGALRSAWHEFHGDNWRIESWTKRPPTDLERFNGTDCVAEVAAYAPPRFEEASIHLQRRFEVVAFDGVHRRSLWLWDGSRETPSKVSSSRRWSENVRGGNWTLPFVLSKVPANWGEVRLKCDLEARDVQGNKNRWNKSLLLRSAGETIHVPPPVRAANFKVLGAHLIEHSPPMFAVELEFSGPPVKNGEIEEATWQELRLDSRHTEGWIADQNGAPLEIGMHDVVSATNDAAGPIPHRFEAQVQLGDNPSPRGDLWLKGRLSANDKWPQDIKIHLRDAKGHWLENDARQCSVKPAVP